MRRKLSAVWVMVLIAGSASASSRATIAFSFVCNGKTFGACPNGGSPNSLIQGSDGNFYGTTANSGSNANGQFILGGTVFSLTSSGKFTLIHTFTGGTNHKFANGAGPISVTEGPDGKLYGLTTSGGNGFSGLFLGYGVLFRVNKNGTGFRVIHRFCSSGTNCTDGVYSAGTLVAAGDGNVYGVTSQGGSGSGCGSGGCGTVFRVTPSSGAYEVVASFTTAYSGFPNGMTLGADGTFYGFTINGTALFHFVPATGTLQSVALPFPEPSGCPGLACTAMNVASFGPDGNLYGFYAVYNAPGVAGIFEVQPDGSHLQLFSPYTTTANPGTELLLASDGNFWFPKITSGSGDIVSLSPSSGQVIQTLTPFNASVHDPVEIIQAKDGLLWGVAAGGIVTSGHYGGGTVFSLNAGLPPR